MSFAFTKAKQQLISGAINLGSDDIRVLLVMTNSTADVNEDVATIGAIGTLDEFNGSGYSSPGLALSGKAIVQDDANNRAYLSGTNMTFAGLGVGTRPIKAAILYKFVTNLGASLPIAYIDSGGFPINANGGDITLQWNAAGIVQAT